MCKPPASLRSQGEYPPKSTARTNLEVMSRKTDRPPQLYSTAKIFAKDASVCWGGLPALSPKEEEDWGYFEGQPQNTTTGVYWERGRLRFTATTSLCPLSLEELGRPCPHDVISGLVSK